MARKPNAPNRAVALANRKPSKQGEEKLQSRAGRYQAAIYRYPLLL